MVKNLPAMQETWVWSLGQDPLEKGMATHSSILAWRIPWTEEPGRLQPIQSQSDATDWLSMHKEGTYCIGTYVYIISHYIYICEHKYIDCVTSFLLFLLGQFIWVIQLTITEVQRLYPGLLLMNSVPQNTITIKFSVNKDFQNLNKPGNILWNVAL